jgi:glycosyltransferase involved in cell wall biosynthesis
LRSIIPSIPAIRPTFLPIAFGVDGLAARVPLYGTNWSVRAGVRARAAVRRANRADPLDALFVHSQVPAVLLGRWMRRIPTVVSLDATPLQYDELGEFYSHDVGNARLERIKRSLNIRCYTNASRIVTWSTWAKNGLVDDYGVSPDHIVVVPPGVWCERWTTPDPGVVTRTADDIVRILFVGADLARKGGDVLLAAFAELRAEHGDGVELHLVTKSEVAPTSGVHCYANLSPNSDELKALYHRCDVFCLPTRGDCLPMVLSEAGATGLPLVSTGVAAIPEIVQDGSTGLVVPAGDIGALAAALSKLVADAPLREQMGARARALVEQSFDASKNAAAVVELMREVAGEAR